MGVVSGGISVCAGAVILGAGFARLAFNYPRLPVSAPHASGRCNAQSGQPLFVRACVGVGAVAGDAFLGVRAGQNRFGGLAEHGGSLRLELALSHPDGLAAGNGDDGSVGADVVFIEAPMSVAELEAIAERVPYPKFVNMLPGG